MEHSIQMGFFVPYSASPGWQDCEKHIHEDLVRMPGCSWMRWAETGFLDTALCSTKWWLELVWKEVTANRRLWRSQKSNRHLYRDLQARLCWRGLIIPDTLIAGSGRGMDGLCSDFLEGPTALLNSGSQLSLYSADGHSNLSTRVRQLTEWVQLIVTGGRGMPCVRKWHPTITDVDKRYGVN